MRPVRLGLDRLGLDRLGLDRLWWVEWSSWGLDGCCGLGCLAVGRVAGCCGWTACGWTGAAVGRVAEVHRGLRWTEA
ncbi:hypothetical protein ACWGE0_32430 [Lentzea sp. NPDC054927]